MGKFYTVRLRMGIAAIAKRNDEADASNALLAA
jgi:hypothetical protein